MRRKIIIICDKLLEIIDNHFEIIDNHYDYDSKGYFKNIKNIIKKLDWAREKFGRHGCNDLPDNFWNGWTITERQEFVKKYHEHNGDPEEYNPNFLHLPDFAVMWFVSEYFKGKVKFLAEERKDKLNKLKNYE